MIKIVADTILTNYFDLARISVSLEIPTYIYFEHNILYNLIVEAIVYSIRHDYLFVIDWWLMLVNKKT